MTGRGVALQLHVFQRGRFCRVTRTAPYGERRPPPKLAQRPPSGRSSRQLAPRGLALRGVRLVHQHPKAAGDSEGDASAHENVARTAAAADDTCESCRCGLQIRAHHLDRVPGHVQQVFARGTACLRDSRSAGDRERAARLRAVCFSSTAAAAMHGAAHVCEYTTCAIMARYSRARSSLEPIDRFLARLVAVAESIIVACPWIWFCVSTAL